MEKKKMLFNKKIKQNKESGQSLSEVALFLTLVVVVAILVLTDLGDSVVTTLSTVASAI
jgi:Flp pilus assembly pilin Flp